MWNRVILCDGRRGNLQIVHMSIDNRIKRTRFVGQPNRVQSTMELQPARRLPCVKIKIEGAHIGERPANLHTHRSGHRYFVDFEHHIKRSIERCSNAGHDLRSQQEKLLERFNDKNDPLKLLIVTAKLLTGFDAPILQTMYLDKSLKDHTLLQAICRTNRLFPDKHFGRIVDYFGIFDDAAEALQFDEESVKKVISNMNALAERLPEAMADCLAHFPGVDRTIEGFEGLEAAQNCINSDEKRDAFAKDYVFLGKLWESLSPDECLNPFQTDYRWLTSVYQSVKPSNDNIGKLLWHSLGTKTSELIHQGIHVKGIAENSGEFVLDADVIDDIFNNPDPKKVKKLEKEVVKRLKKLVQLGQFKDLSERLEALRDKAELGLISSIEFVKELCKIARETVEAEKDQLSRQEQKSAKAALTELFLELKNDQTPAVVERIVNDIDQIVKVVRFDGWQTSEAGEREVKKSLRKALLKYKLHKDNTLFERAYAYIKEYY